MTAESRPVSHPADGSSHAANGSADRVTVTKRIWNNQFLFGAAILALVIFLQWPMLKGMYYRVAKLEVPTSAIEWQDDVESAKVVAATSGKPILLVFSASWCPACKVMEHEVWPDPDVSQAANAGFVPVYVDVDDRQHAAVTRRYEVGAIPTVLIVDGDGTVLRQANSMSRSQALRFLTEGPRSNVDG